jgi:tetratricopeptide (TPR) repeat protein
MLPPGSARKTKPFASRLMLTILQAIGHEAAKAELLGDIARDRALLGDHQRARAFCEQSLALIAKLGDREFEHTVWATLGYIEFHLGNFARSAAHFESALGLCRDRGDRLNEAEILAHVGDMRHAADELPQAREAWQQALAILDDIQHPDAGNVRAKLAGMAE